MNWIKTNKFLAGLLGVLIVGIGVFGYLIFSGNQRLEEAREEVEDAENSYRRLSSREEVPVQSVLEDKEETVEKLEAETVKLHKQMVERYGARSEGGDPATFGQRVEARYNELREMWEANEATKMKVPNEFFLGFEKYRTSIQAQPSAVAELDSQLAGLSWLVEQAVAGGIDEILRYDRELVEGEEGPGSDADDDSQDADSPLNRYTLTASFRGSEDEIRSLLNTIVSSEDHLFGIRYVKLRNSKDVAPTRSSVESQVEEEKPEPSNTGGSVFDGFTGFTEEGEEGGEPVNPFAGMSDAERRAQGVTADPEDEEEEVSEEEGDGLTSNAGRQADFTEEPGVQNAVVFLGTEDVTLTVVLDYVIFAPVAEEEEEAAE